MFASDEMQNEFENDLNHFRNLLKNKDSSDITDLFSQKNIIADTAKPETEQPTTNVHEKYKMRLRAFAQALSEHPYANYFTGSIEVLRRITENKLPRAN